MAHSPYRDETPSPEVEDHQTRHSLSDISTVSSISAVLEQINELQGHSNGMANGHDDKLPLMHDEEEDDRAYDAEKLYSQRPAGPSKTTKRVLWVMCGIALGGWLLALFLFLKNGTITHVSDIGFEHNESPEKAGSKTSTGSGSGKAITLDSTMNGEWASNRQHITWISSPNGEDGLILEENGGGGRGALVVEDVRARKDGDGSEGRITLVKDGGFRVDGEYVQAEGYWPSADLKHVLIMSERRKVFRHSFTALYWIWDVEKQEAQPLDPKHPKGRVQLAQWSPKSDNIVFTRNNNLFMRELSSGKVNKITKDGGADFFYGIPDWVYEEEVFADNIGAWWSNDGEHVAFLQTNETEVPEYPVQYFISRPSGSKTLPGEENYPDEYRIKYPKAGAPNPTVHLKFFSIKEGRVYDVKIDNDFPDDDRLITEVVWGEGGRVIVRETNRESDTLKTILINTNDKSGKVVRELDVMGQDGGWFEVAHYTRFVPSDPSKGRAHSGYIDTIVHEGYDHLAYFTPLDNPNPVLLTSGEWEVVDAPASIDLNNNVVYFVATKQGPATRHVYSVKLDGTDLKPLDGIDDQKDAYWEVSFSSGAGFALMTYEGPGIPTQQVISTPANKQSFHLELENNDELRKKAAAHDLPDRTYSTVHNDGVDIPVLELRPPHFDSRKKYPVVLAPYGGPNSQQVHKRWNVDFQVYLAATLGYIVLIADGRGTGFKGRSYRCVVRGDLGAYEAADQIAVAKSWSSKPFVDSDRIAIWGWSFGGFLTLKTLELDAHETFSYGVAVAPVTDWRLYDSVYTERYMHTPQHNPGGYENSTITNMTALTQNVRFLVMHGTGDDNVHYQNSLRLLDRLDQAGASNYDFHAFPDSDHSIYFHNAHAVVYQKLNDWLINAFNGEWLRIEDPVPMSGVDFDKRADGVSS